MSDTHLLHEQIPVPDGDVLIHGGDFLGWGNSPFEVVFFATWMENLPHPTKLLIAGNHDLIVEQNEFMVRRILREKGIVYLQDEPYVLEDGTKLYGSPWTPRWMNWAFMKDKGEELRKVWEKVPEDTELLVTHGPPTGFLSMKWGEDFGDAQLRNRIEVLPNLKLHVFGHAHECFGKAEHTTHAGQDIELYNVSMVSPTNEITDRKPVALEM